MSTFPTTRLRRLRRTPATRGLVQETRLDVAELVFPMFVCPGVGVHAPLEGLPGIARRSVDLTCEEAEELYGLGIRAVLLFGIPEEKDEIGLRRLRRGRHRPAGAARLARPRARARPDDGCVPL